MTMAENQIKHRINLTVFGMKIINQMVLAGFGFSGKNNTSEIQTCPPS